MVILGKPAGKVRSLGPAGATVFARVAGGAAV
jgi:hypothetical protein